MKKHSDQPGARMRRLRERHGVQQKFVAQKLGLSRAYLCDLEHDRRNWSPELAVKYAALFP